MELALRGAFVDVPEALFFQGCHGENLVAKYPDARDQPSGSTPRRGASAISAFAPANGILANSSSRAVTLEGAVAVLRASSVAQLRHPQALLLWDFFKPAWAFLIAFLIISVAKNHSAGSPEPSPKCSPRRVRVSPSRPSPIRAFCRLPVINLSRQQAT